MMYVISLVFAYAWPLWLSNLILNYYGFLVIRFPCLATYDKPLDLHKNFFDRNRIFGRSSTCGGLIISLIYAVTCSFLLPFHPYIFLKCISGFVGHTLASFIKRRCGTKKGGYIPFLTHVDYILFFGLILFFLDQFITVTWLATYGITLVITPLITYGFYTLGFRKDPL